MANICIIPARGGSKRIPRKNIRDFRGRPMLEWSVIAAFDAGCFDRVIVSTDDPEIADIALSCGAEIPFLRPAALANDYAGTREVVVHAIEYLEPTIGEEFFVCCLYATSPFVRPADLLQGRELLQKSRPNTFVFAATSFPFPIQRAVRIDDEGYSSAIDPASAAMRSQDLEEMYHDAGQFYWAAPADWIKIRSLFDSARPLILPRWRVQDIDTLEDWKRAELLHALLEEGQVNE